MLTKSDLISVFSTIGLAVVLIIIAVVCAKSPVGDQTSLYLAASVGALGGLAHEIAQSGGKILFFERKADGFYLGSLSGMILGAVAGILAARVLFTAEPPKMTNAELIYETFMAGLALKGVVEAAGGQAVSSPSATNPTAPQLPQLPPPPPTLPRL